MRKLLIFLFLVIAISSNLKAQLFDTWTEECKFSYYIHKNFDADAFMIDTNFLEKPAYLNVVFKLNKKYDVDFIEITGRANDKMRTEIEKALRKAMTKANCDTVHIKPRTYYSFPLLFRVKQVSVSYNRAKKIDKKPKLLGEAFKDSFYDDLLSSFNEYKLMKLVFDKPVILLPIVDLESSRR
jgi:hypothetical protein